jgi:hypothetical protein
MQKRIKLNGEHVRKLQNEFDCTMQTVRMSLQYVFNSDKAISIRKRAKQLLIEEANQIED